MEESNVLEGSPRLGEGHLSSPDSESPQPESPNPPGAHVSIPSAISQNRNAPPQSDEQPRHPSRTPLSPYEPHLRRTPTDRYPEGSTPRRNTTVFRNVEHGPIDSRPLPPVPSAATPISRRGTHSAHSPLDPLEYVVPTISEKPSRKTAGKRLKPTLDKAEMERAKLASSAKVTSYMLNIAIGLQVLLGALTTGISAALQGRTSSIAVSILGGTSTVLASYLARTRGSGEPETSFGKLKDMEHFIRECESFKMDHGDETGPEYDEAIRRFRDRFEELMGNTSGNVNDDRRHSSV